ncbi:MAG: TfoX/Sxy family protein [Spirochaetia bacterium]
MKWQKAPEELKVLIERVMAGIDCQKRPMFGYPAYFINGNMFAGLFQSSLFIRLSAAQVADLTPRHPMISPLEPMPGRPMKEYFVIPEALYRQEEAIRGVAVEAAAYVRTLAPKAQKRKTAAKAVPKKRSR